MTREEALKAATIWAAEAHFEEKLKGTLEAGKLADFVVIDRDYMRCDVEEIKDINALMTVRRRNRVPEITKNSFKKGKSYERQRCKKAN